ncbi:hypothetical protein DMB38_20540 [Streptomyces sp. WAC 06738]|uniref:hypothetical protein n=1 Tax=Streptomyces sp. WAC 06738 TaxID=2203210 RepID=UPI000F6B3A86|nr:hypothetical protein [Streptomyces sp. WAC 06738]AZM47859.1 hypothetical protein DMB38_20540 [Streptomyces sp. WAC 06738]
MSDAEKDEEEVSVRTRYAVSWQWTGRPGQTRRSTCIVDSAQMTRPGDPEQRDQLIRTTLSKSSLPLDQGPENVILDMVVVLCNCEPLPTRQHCVYREHQGQRFYMTSSQTYAHMEVIHDRHRDRIIGIVSITESVAFLTQVREKYGHQ